jgi:hypothetical protein
MSTAIRQFVSTLGASALATGVLLAAAPVLCPPLSTPAMAQASGMAGIGASETLSLRAKVTAIDVSTRMVTLVGPRGRSVTLQAGPEVQNLPQVKPGDMVNVVYHASVTYVLTPRGAKAPGNSMTAAGMRAAPEQMPGAAVGAKIVVTATVVGMDMAGHTLQLIDPDGGKIRTVDVVTPEGQQAMKMVKIGDSLTGIASEAVAIDVEPAK